MFKVEADSVEAYLAVDPTRQADLQAFDGLMQAAAPKLTRYFHAGTPVGTPGMRFKMIGYGRTTDARGVEWPMVGLALQKAYISVYVSVEATDPWRGRLGEKRMGKGNFSFVRFADLRADAVALMLANVAQAWLDRLQT